MIKNSYFNKSYQPHIDGIRALAVIIVWLFHINPLLFPGGYIGVDMFFVISGYVISLSIFKDIEKNKNIQLIYFYKKRFFRIFPAVFFLILFTFIFYLFFGYLFELNYVSKISISSLLGISNFFYIFLKSNYFLENELNPFLHTWSLGVEEQFYFIYPIIIYIALFTGIKLFGGRSFFLLKIILLLFTSISFLIFFFLPNTLIGNFYSPLSRFWELLIGCLLFFFIGTKKKKIPYLIYFLFIVILFIVIFFESYINNIYLTLIFAIILACIFIISDNKYFKLFENFYFSYIGKMSFSLYLWHLPIIYFTKIYFTGIIFFLINLIFLTILSFISYNFIEKSFRFNKYLQKLFTIFLLLFFIILSTLFLYDYFMTNSKLDKNYYNIQINKLDNYFKNKNFFERKFYLSTRTKWDLKINNNNIHNCEYSHSTYKQSNTIDSNCLHQNNKNKLFVIYGDSHATHYYPMIKKSSNASIYLRSYEGCMFVPEVYVVGKKDFRNKNFKNFANCQKYIKDQIKVIKNISPKYDEIFLIISSRYTAYINQSFLMDKEKNFIENAKINNLIYRSLSRLASELIKINIIFISPLPEFENYPYSCFLNNELCDVNIKDDQNRISDIKNILLNLSKKNNNIYFFDPYFNICNLKNTTCKMYNKEKNILFFKDTDHLTVEGSKFLSKYFNSFLNKNFNTFN